MQIQGRQVLCSCPVKDQELPCPMLLEMSFDPAHSPTLPHEIAFLSFTIFYAEIKEHKELQGSPVNSGSHISQYGLPVYIWVGN